MVSVNTVLEVIKMSHKDWVGSEQRLTFSRNREDPDDAREAGPRLLWWPPGQASKNYSRRPVVKEPGEGMGRGRQASSTWSTSVKAKQGGIMPHCVSPAMLSRERDAKVSSSLPFRAARIPPHYRCSKKPSLSTCSHPTDRTFYFCPGTLRVCVRVSVCTRVPLRVCV